MVTIEKCPVCSSPKYSDYLDVKDYANTKERFTIVECHVCGLHYTNPRPSEENIEKYYQAYDYVSHTSSNRGVINWLYNQVRKQTLREKVRWVRNVVHGDDLLDVGSGTGHFLKVANERGFRGVGLEPSENARDFAHRVNEVRSSAQSDLYKIEARSFDVVTMWHVLEHVYHLEKDLTTIHQILRNNGRLVIAVPNMNSFDARMYKKYWAAYDVPRHLYHFKQENLSRLMLNHGFELKKVIPMKFDAYYISMLSEKYRSRLSLVGLVFGFISNRFAKRFGYSSQAYIFSKRD